MAAATSKNCKKTLRLTPAGESDEDLLKFIEEMTENCDEVQKIVLAEILKQNGEAEYLRRHSVAGGGDADPAAFKAKIPVVSYEDLQSDIQRIVSGDRSAILSGRPISEFLTSSGTSAGERKLMPTIKEDLDRRQLLFSLLMPVMKQYVPGLDKGKALYFMFVKSETITPGGLLARPVLTSYYKSRHFQLRPSHSGDPFSMYTSPTAAVLCSDSYQSMYIQMLCGLHHRLQVLRAGAIFASGLLRAIHFLQTHWPQLAHDIAAGELSPSITDPYLRASVADLLSPNPDLACFISNECSKPDWAGIITRIWPNTKYLDVVITGAMAQYIPTLQYFSAGLPMASTMYASSECFFGLNLKPMCPPSEISYTIMPNLGFFEFLPIAGDGDELIDLAGVEVGKEYELVVTTYAGLYRYRVGDVLRVTGFYNSAPQFKFLRRKNVVLSIESDKTDEAELQRAVERAAAVLEAAAAGVSVVEYTCQACTDTIPGHYVIYWELLRRRKAAVAAEEEMLEDEVMEKCCLEMEEEMNSVYRQSRVADRSIGPLEIRVVRTGTFEELMDYAITRGSSINQYKVPRCVNFKPILELLDSRVVCSYFSKGLPRWSPTRFD